VSGLINADLYRVDRRSGELIECTIGDKDLAIDSRIGGGTEQRSLSAEERRERVLDDHEVASLVALGEQIEATYQGVPQDIEWCITPEGEVFVVQSRPITTLYPLMQPRPVGDELEIGLSMGHMQMMTKAMRPLGLSTIKQVFPLGRRMHEPRESPWLRVAGSRLYLEMGRMLRSRSARRAFLAFAPNIDPLAAKALAALAMRPGFVASGPRMRIRDAAPFAGFMVGNLARRMFLRSPEAAVDQINSYLEGELAAIRARIAASEGLAGRLRCSVRELQLTLHKAIVIFPAVIAGMIAGNMLRKLCPGYERQITALGRALQGNVTTSMDLEVGDLADCARSKPQVREALQNGLVDLDALAQLVGGAEFRAAVGDFLGRYGMRGPGEFDLTNPRWQDEPASLLSMIAGNLGHENAGAHRLHHERLAKEAEEAAAELFGLSWGVKRRIIRRLVRLHRFLPALREHPKYFLIRVMARVREEVLRAAEKLVLQGRMDRPEQVFFLEYREIIAALEEPSVDLRRRIHTRIQEYEGDRARTPPRVMTSEGEIPRVSHSGEVPLGALAGSGVSAGVVEGIARVVTDPVGQVLKKGEILVAPYTDPGWTPLFINAAGVVIEVGGMMTHGSVVAREYGIPAVVSVPSATSLLRSGQKIRVNGDEGWAMVVDAGAHETVD
ncbi:MAG TPA: phosphoenolpyruvate synthase, partial [Nannocystis exedens]|nr:phosphoenolpyruvate synthase [Nannocystis exedens]